MDYDDAHVYGSATDIREKELGKAPVDQKINTQNSDMGSLIHVNYI